jgi:hypothetical protein
MAIAPVETLKVWSINGTDAGNPIEFFIAAYPLSVWPT